MTRIKCCGLMRPEDIEAANELKVEYIGFVFARKSRRYVSPQRAAMLKKDLHPDIKVVGVFVDEEPDMIAGLLDDHIIDMAQLHGNETAEYIRRLRRLTEKPIIRAFRIGGRKDIADAKDSPADYILLDSGNGGTGTVFDWSLAKDIRRPYFLAGGLRDDNVRSAIEALEPYAVDVSSGIETDGVKDRAKMAAFAAAVRESFPEKSSTY